MSTMNAKTKILIYATFALSVVCAALRAFCALFFYDGDIGYYKVGAVLPLIANILFWLSIAALVFFSFFCFRKNGSVDAVKGNARYFALVPAAALLFPLVETAKEIITELRKPFGEVGIFSVLIVISVLISMVFFALLAFSDEVSNTVTVLTGAAVILWLALCWINSYGDFFTAMNSPDKMFFHFACVGAALFITGELRALCSTAKPRSYISYLSVCILSTSSFVVMDLTDRISGISLKNAASLSQTVVMTAILVYAVARAFSLISGAKKSQADDAEVISEPQEEICKAEPEADIDSEPEKNEEADLEQNEN